MSYYVKEMFLTLQGEGFHTGRAAVFCRFAGCNLWSGQEKHRLSAVCQFCDTEFVGTDGDGGGRFRSAGDLAGAVARTWNQRAVPSWATGLRFVVCTGGEPLLQMDAELVEALHARGFRIAIETNGTLEPPKGIDWICVSPKAGAELVLRRGNELKLVVPQAFDPADFEEMAFDHFYLQPMDGPDLAENTAAAVQHCIDHPRWRLSLQTHKFLGIR